MAAPHATRKLMMLRELLIENLTKYELCVRLDQNQKLVERTVKALKSENEFLISGHKHVLDLETPEIFNVKISRLFEEVVTSEYPSYYYGQLSLNLMKTHFQYFWAKEYREAIDKLLLFLNAMETSETLKFFYQPQTEGTLEKWNYIRPKLETLSIGIKKKEAFQVTAIPSSIIFSYDTILLLCETFFGDSDDGQIRQYDLRGIPSVHEIKSFVQKSRSLGRLDPREVYQNSVNTWIGGNEHKLTLQELIPGRKDPITTERIVNGEKEIIDYILKSNGTVKIVNPPQELQDYVDWLGESHKKVFIFNSES